MRVLGPGIGDTGRIFDSGNDFQGATATQGALLIVVRGIHR